MGRTMIEIFNSTVSDAVNKDNAIYTAWIGADPFTPEAQILESEDVNCGAVCNELEFGRTITQYFVKSLDIDQAEDDELETLIDTFIELPRRGVFEADSVYRDRYKFIVVEQGNPKRTTKWAILDALSHFIDDMSGVSIVEIFDSESLYFQVRIDGLVSTNDIIFLNNLETAWVDLNYIGGPSLGAVITYVAELLDRIKAAGVDYDVLFVDQNTFDKASSAFLGTIQRYKSVDTIIMSVTDMFKYSNATIV